MKLQKMKIKTLLTAAFLAILAPAGVVQAQTPGGASNATPVVWLTPDSYASGTWTNKIINTVGNFIAPQTAPDITTGYNFNRSVVFTKSDNGNARNRLESQTSRNLANDDNITAIFVHKRKTNGYGDHDFFSFNYNAGNVGHIVWNSAGSAGNDFAVYWPGTEVRFGNNRDEGILTVDIANAASSAINVYMNGGNYTGKNHGGKVSYNTKWVLGAGYNNSYGYEGEVQEVIILKSTDGSKHLSASDLKKIHSYLAIKYGFTLNNNDNYVNSSEAVVWDKATNSGYNNNIFGIGRDDASGLYQKQSRSQNSNLLTVFTGDRLAELNELNNGTLADKQYLVIGSNGQTGTEQATVSGQYENGAIPLPAGMEFRSKTIYKAQLTGTTSMEVNLQIRYSDCFYVLVSKSAAFGNSETKRYPVNQGQAEVTIDQDYKYIRYVGYTTGPGGVVSNLLMWMRADDENLTVNNLSSSDGKLAGYPEVNGASQLPAVAAWNDPARDITYSYSAGTNGGNHRIPVYKQNSPLTNFHPAVHFYGTGAYLSRSESLLPTPLPTSNKITTYFLVNNDFGTNDFIHTMMFGNVNPNSGESSYYGPGFGVQKTGNSNVVGRFRSGQGTGAGYETTGSAHLFDVGSTSILGYQATVTGTSNNSVKFRFNGKEDNTTFSRTGNGMRLNQPSVLGSGGVNLDRTMQGVMSEVIMFGDVLNEADTRKLETYLAVKYGVTLFPSNTTYKRFDYTFSNDKVFWQGNQASGKYVDFYNNIAAIIRDDASNLHNVHSHSTHANSLVHIGVANNLPGAKLGKNPVVGKFDHDREVVVWGSTAATGISQLSANGCGDMDSIFNKKWMVRKVTNNNRPITLLVGAENNSQINFGKGQNTNIANYYSKLNFGYSVVMIVADSPQDIDNRNFRAVIPMSYIDGEHQCLYTFAKEETYITFAYKLNRQGGCLSEIEFAGTKTFPWTQWTPSPNTTTSNTAKNLTRGVYSLGDGIQVNQTNVEYPAGVISSAGYPRSVSTPVNGSLEIQRRDVTAGQKITTTITFNTPVSPSFQISGIDGYQNSYEEVSIAGYCDNNTPYTPMLNYASSPRNARYAINGNTATATKNGNVSGADKNGMLDVEFQIGVKKIVIEYSVKSKVNATYPNRIYISPITLRSVPPAPPVNEDGLSFVKQVKERSITTCDPVEYSFYIRNTSCNPRYVNFADILPEKMKWTAETLGLDSVNGLRNTAIKINNYGGSREMKIDSLLLPGSSLLKLTATAMLDENASSGRYDNQAAISYERTENNTPSSQSVSSSDRETLEAYAWFNATYTQRQDTVQLKVTTSQSAYKATNEIEVTYTLNNPNPTSVSQMLLNVRFNPEFTYKSGSLQVSGTTADMVAQNASFPASLLTIAGSGGTGGFDLPANNVPVVIKFTLVAPDLSGLQDQLDDNGNPTGTKAPLNIFYEFTSDASDSCVQCSLSQLQGVKRLPYGSEITHIIINKHVSPKIKR